MSTRSEPCSPYCGLVVNQDEQYEKVQGSAHLAISAPPVAERPGGCWRRRRSAAAETAPPRPPPPRSIPALLSPNEDSVRRNTPDILCPRVIRRREPGGR